MRALHDIPRVGRGRAETSDVNRERLAATRFAPSVVLSLRNVHNGCDSCSLSLLRRPGIPGPLILADFASSLASLARGLACATRPFTMMFAGV
jgi:hypothetical protein